MGEIKVNQPGVRVFDFLRYRYNLDAREMWKRLQAREVKEGMSEFDEVR